MSAFFDTFSPRFIDALGAALLHSIWQAALVAAVLALALRAFKNTSPHVWYILCVGALALMALLPVATGLQVYYSTSLPSYMSSNLPAFDAADPETRYAQPYTLDIAVAGGNETSETLSAPPDYSGFDALRTLFAASRPFIVLFWMIGVVFFALRLAGGLFAVSRLKRNSFPISDASLDALYLTLVNRMQIARPVLLQSSSQTDQPLLVGWLKPMILLPTSLLTGIHPEHIEAIMAHELAHIHRHDYLVSLLQAVVETLFFYHPAVWWVSRLIRVEREYCCDDLALAVLNDEAAYVKALASLETKRVAGPILATGAADGRLVDRIRRIVEQKPERHVQRSSWIPLAGVILASALILAACETDELDLENSTPEELYEAGLTSLRERDLVKAGQLLRKSAEGGNICAMQIFSELLSADVGPANRGIFDEGFSWALQDADESRYWEEQFQQELRREAENGNTEAMMWLYRAHHTRWMLGPAFSHIEKNDSLALTWVNKAIDAGSAVALRASISLQPMSDEEKNRRYEEAALKGDGAAYFYWALDNAAHPEIYFQIAELAIDNRAQGAHYWISETLDKLEEQVQLGNEEALRYMDHAEGLNLKDRLQLLSDTTGPSCTPRFQHYAIHCRLLIEIFLPDAARPANSRWHWTINT